MKNVLKNQQNVMKNEQIKNDSFPIFLIDLFRS